MIPQLIIEEAEKSKAQYIYHGGVLQSVKPAETMYGFNVFSHMIPPYRPEHTLMLGYGGGTVPALMRKIWGDCKITGVDIEPRNDRFLEHKIKVMDAKDFLIDATKGSIFKNSLPIIGQTKYDYVCVDLWEGGKVCDFVFDVEFAVRLKEIATKLISFNIRTQDTGRMKGFFNYGYQFLRFVPVEGNSVQWWEVK